MEIFILTNQTLSQSKNLSKMCQESMNNTVGDAHLMLFI